MPLEARNPGIPMPRIFSGVWGVGVMDMLPGESRVGRNLGGRGGEVVHLDVTRSRKHFAHGLWLGDELG
ncbi:MAG TPA: hypothetical protein PKM72_11760 [Nitrospirales bacterium]|nr:hypothetical protein [Nitrospirales bacterium]